MSLFEDLKKYRAQKKAEEEKNNKKTITYKKPEATDSGDPLAIEERAKFAPLPSHVGASYDLYDSSNYLKDQLESNLYKVGGSEQIKKSGIINASDSIGKEAQWRKKNYTESNLADNIEGDVDYWFNFLNKMSDDTTTAAQEVNNLAKARTGDTSWQDDDSLTKQQKDELGRANKLYGVDQYYEADQGNKPNIKPPKEVFSALEYSDWEQRMNDGDPNAYQEYLDRALADTGATYKDYETVVGAHGELDKNAAAAEKKYKDWQTATNEASASLRKNEDFAEKSQYVPDGKYGQDMFYENWRMQGHINPDGSIFDTATEKEYAINALLNDWVAAGQDEEALKRVQEKAEIIGADLQRYNIEAIPYMTPTQQEDFFYHVNNGDMDGAKKLLEDLDYGLQKKRWETESKAEQAWWDQAKWWEKAGASLASVPVNFMNEIVGGSQELASIFNKDALSDVHEYSPVYDYGREVQNIRGNASQDIREGAEWANIPGTDMNLLDMGYQGLMSGLDSLFNAWVAGKVGAGNFGKLGKAAPAAAMGAGAYATTRRDALKSGKGEENANVDAFISQLIETGTEYLPFDNLGKHVIAPLKKAGYGILAEDLGESVAEIANTAYDTIKYRNQSEAGQYYNELLTQGYDKSDAIWKTVGKYGLQVLESGLTGAMSGSVSAGISAARDNSGMKKEGKNILANSGVADLVKVAESLRLDGSNAKVLADVKAALEAEGNTDVSDITDAEIEEAAAEEFEAEEAAPEDVVSEATQIDAQGVVDAVMQDVAGQTEGDVSAIVETAVADAIDFIAKDANENGGENSENVLDTAMMVAENAMGDVSAQDAQKLKESIRSALSNAYDTFKSEAGGAIESAKQKRSNKAKAEARAEEQRQAEADKAARREAEMKKKATEQAWKEVRAAAENAGKTADELFDLASRRAGDILYEMRQKAADAVKSHAEAEAAKQAEQNQREQAERAEEGKAEDTSDFVAPQEWIEAAENEAAQEAETKTAAENETSEVIEESEQKTETKDESSEKAEESIDAEDADTVEEAEQALQDKAHENNQQRDTSEQAKTARDKGERKSKGKRSKVSPAKVGQLYRASMAKLDAQAQEVLSTAYARTLEGQLSEKGITGDAAKTISKQLADAIGGREFTPYIRNLITNNATVRQIYMDSMAKVETAESEKSNLEYMAAYDHGKFKTAPKVVAPEDLEADEIKVEAEEGDTAAEIVTKNAAKYLGEQAATMENMYNAETQDAAEYAEAFVRAVNYGKDGRNLDVLLKQNEDGKGNLSTLTAGQIKAAYTIGQEMRRNAPTAARVNSKGITVGKVDLKGINMGSLNKHQRSSVYAATRLAKAIGFNIKFVESKANALGQYTTENGSWDARTMTLTLDVHAGSNSVRDTGYAMMHTMGHELTHFIKQYADGGMWNDYQAMVMDHLSTKMSTEMLDNEIAKLMKNQPNLTRDGAIEEIIADASVEALNNITEADLAQIADTNPGLLKKIGQFIQKWVKDIKAAIKAAYSDTESKTEVAKAMEDQLDEFSKKWNQLLVNAAQNRRAEAQGAAVAENASVAEAIPMSVETQQAINNDQAVDAEAELKHSLRMDVEFGEEAARVNGINKFVSAADMQKALADRKIIRDIFLDPKNRDLLKLPPDIEGDTFVSDSSYGGTEENTTVCIRSMAAQALMDLISQNLGRPLTVQDTLLISQEIAGLTDRPECYYCYVATDRRAYRDFLGQYLEQRNKVIEKYKAGADRAELYEEFLGGRKPTRNMRNRFDMWLNAVDNGTALIDGNDLASLENLFNEIDGLRNDLIAAAAEVSEVEAGKLTIVDGKVQYTKSGKKVTAITLKALAKSNPAMADSINRYNQLTDATAYAQSASWAKKMKGYAAYNGHILKWSQKRVNDLNKHYGLRMYSFSDFSPAFILENMQMVTDASVRGLNMLGYTKEMPFAEIFAPSGMNINISTFAYEQGGEVKEDYKQGASWERAKALREKHPNVGIVMVATSDNILEWALKQDWVDVVIPYHLVRTGTDVAEYFGYKNYTGVSADGKGLSFAEKNKGKSKKERVTSVSPVEHRNDLIAYVDALQRYGLTPRFANWLNGLDAYLAGEISPNQFRKMNPNYMKLVNETRRSYADTAPVQPKFDIGAAQDAIDQMVREGGYYSPVGGSMEAQFEIAGNIADKIRNTDGVKLSAREEAEMANTAAETSDANTRYSIRDTDPPKHTIKAYKAFDLVNGKLYPPMVNNDAESLFRGGNKETKDGRKVSAQTNRGLDTPVGVWLDAEIGAWAKNEDGTPRTNTYGRLSVQNAKSKSQPLAFRPGWHLGEYPLAGQFVLADGTQRDDLVYCEVEMSADYNYQLQAMSYGMNVKGSGKDYDTTQAGLPEIPVNGYYKYRTNPTKGEPWYIAGSIKVTRILTDAECREIVREKTGGAVDWIPRHSGNDLSEEHMGGLKFGNVTPTIDVKPYIASERGIKNAEELRKVLAALKGTAYVEGKLDFDSPKLKAAFESYKTGRSLDFYKVLYEKQGTNPMLFEDDPLNHDDGYDGKKLSTRAAEDADAVRYQQRDLSELSDRELLVQALEGELTEAERDHLNRYKARVDELGEKQMKLEALNTQIAQLKAEGKTAKTSEELRAAQTNAKTLRDSIARLDAKLWKTEGSEMFKSVIQRNREENAFKRNEEARVREAERRRIAVAEARKSAYALARERADERQRKAVEKAREVGQRKVERVKESHGKEKYKKRILDDTRKLMSWLTSPTNKEHVPKFLATPIGDFLESIDFSSKSALKGKGNTKADEKMIAALDTLRHSLENYRKNQNDFDSGKKEFIEFIDMPSEFVNSIDELVWDLKKGDYKVVHRKGLDERTNDVQNAIKGYSEADKDGVSLADTPLNRMNSDQLKRLSEIITTIKTSVNQMNRSIGNSRYESIRTMSGDTIDDMNSMTAKVKTNKALESLNSIFNWKNTTPYYAFQRLGRGGKAIFEGLQDGWDKMARNSAKLIEFAKDTFSGKEAKEWSRDVSEVTLSSGDVIQMTTAQKMSLYCHGKRVQSVKHLMGGGIRMSDIDGKRGATISQAENYVLTQKDISNIIGSLTARQIEVADALQKFMNTVCKKWGNEISMKRFGYEQMTEDNYFPIETDANNRSGDVPNDGGTSMFRLLNMGSLKPLNEKANNAIIIRNIFDVFSDHSADMAKYNALALPILDYIKWYNYVERTNVVDASGQPTGQIKTRSTQKALERAYGVNAKQYLNAFIKDLNAEHDGGRNDGLINKLIGKAKAASVGANLRVYFLQITSLPRAAYAISPKYLMKGLLKMKNLNPANAKNGTDAQKDIGILQWKDLGFYSTDINNSVRDLVKRDGGVMDKVREAQMAPAGWGDNWVGNILYEAAKAEMADRHPKLEPGSDVYNKMLNKRVREIVYKTQVVDSTMTRSDFMRSKGLSTLATAFMSEPTLTVNMLNEGIQEAIMKKRGLTSEDLNPTGKIGKAFATFAVTAVMTSALEAVFDALRDDDDYEEFLEKYLSALKGNVIDNINIFAMLPVIKDAFSIIVDGYEDNSLITQTFSNARGVIDTIAEYKEGKRPAYAIVYDVLKTLSSMTGLAAANATRDAVSIYNTAIADAFNAPKLQTYSDSKSNMGGQYYNALTAGDTDKAEWILERAEVYGKDAGDMESKINELAKEDYLAGKIDDKTALEMMTKHGGKKAKNAESALLTWKYEAETGGSYSDLQEEYQAGNVSKEQAIKYMMQYGGKTKEAATKQVNKWAYEEETGSSYDDIRDDYISGNLTEAQLRKHLAAVEGLDEEKIEDRISQYDYTAHTGKTTKPAKYWRLAYTYETGGNYKAYADELFKQIMSNGKSWKQARKSIASSLASYYEEDYLAIKGTPQGDKMLEEILDVYEAIGYERGYERKYIAENWKLDD